MSSVPFVIPETYSLFCLTQPEFDLLTAISVRPRSLPGSDPEAVLALLGRHLARGRRAGRVLAITPAGEALLAAITALDHHPAIPDHVARLLPFKRRAL